MVKEEWPMEGNCNQENVVYQFLLKKVNFISFILMSHHKRGSSDIITIDNF